ncbi:MarR family transcriptional regulator [Bacteroides acidifaciens]|uniref:MarR family transcriptional regulator n=1 Tax=Bacteroides acidifaciens TaxID=85831 RepID=UPI0025ADECEF|nr:MarR family transcriptional regulator [Bacteroides acidifaciens]
MKVIKWTKEKIDCLCELFPVESTAYTASVLGVSEGTVKKKASELGLTKYVKSKWLERAEYIRRHFNEQSFAEIGNALGISKWSVARIAAELGLKRNRAVNSSVASRVRVDTIKRERRRILFGLAPITRLKVVCNRPRIRLRSRMKSKGYIVSRGENTVYYTSDVIRNESQEQRGRDLGLRILPLPIIENESLLEHAI